MVLWMKKAAASSPVSCARGMAQALETGSLAVFTLAFLAVGREGFETALFMVGYAEAETAWPLVGLLVGVLDRGAIAYGMYVGAVRINLSKFFTYTGVFLIFVAAGILATASERCRPSDGCPGWAARLLTSRTGLTGRPGTASWCRAFSISLRRTLLQLIVWLTYLVVVLTLFLRPTREPASPLRRHRKVGASQPTPERSTT